MPKRCAWVDRGNALYEHYHDTEWGVPVYEDRLLFEFLILEGAQAGLSWLTILKKREGYRDAFAGFDPMQVARYTEEDIGVLLQNEGIVRNRLKVRAAVANARGFLEVQKKFGSFSKYQWQFVDEIPVQNVWRHVDEVPQASAQAEAFSRDLKRRGFAFVGPTIMYAHMQAVGMVNDHTADCFRYEEVKSLAALGSP